MALTATLLSLWASNVNAAGKPAAPVPGCGTPAECGPTTPTPVRPVVMNQVGTTLFHLPNGALMNLSAELNTIMNTATTTTPFFQPSDPASISPCQTHLELRSAVSILDLNVAEIGVHFGFSPAGAISTVTNLTGKMNVKIGTIAMDFSLWKCVDGQCSSIAASTANQVTAGINLAIDMDFTAINTGTSLIYNTPLGDAIRAIMNDGMRRLSDSTRVNELPWQAEVREFVPEMGTLIFDAGRSSRILPNQTFEVYAATSTTSQGACDVYKVVAYVHTTSVDQVSSTAIVDKLWDSRGIQPGDVVMIRDASLH